MQKLNTNQTKQRNQNTAQQNYPGSVASYDTRPGNEVGLFYNDTRLGPRNPHGATSRAPYISSLLNTHEYYGVYLTGLSVHKLSIINYELFINLLLRFGWPMADIARFTNPSTYIYFINLSFKTFVWHHILWSNQWWIDLARKTNNNTKCTIQRC